jgi:peptide/nickel transport system ATP-binding protein
MAYPFDILIAETLHSPQPKRRQLQPDRDSALPPLLEVRGLSKTFISRGLFTASRSVVAAEDISFSIRRGEAVALVGESGSGKSTVARLLLRLELPDGGEILLDGEDILMREPRRASLAYRGRVQMVFQDPFGSLNPVHDVAHHLIRPLLRHRRAGAAEARQHAVELLRTVGLEPAEEFIGRHPYELSGGQRQRVAIARALAVDPDLLVADEPTSMLDVSIRMGVLNLLARLKRERQLAILLITHDLASARYLADRILVLFRGRVVEDGSADAVVRRPAHPYTRALLASIADIDGASPPEERPVEVEVAEEPGGCPFAHRCPEVMDICRATEPASRLVDGRRVRCHLYAEDTQARGS